MSIKRAQISSTKSAIAINLSLCHVKDFPPQSHWVSHVLHQNLVISLRLGKCLECLFNKHCLYKEATTKSKHLWYELNFRKILILLWGQKEDKKKSVKFNTSIITLWIWTRRTLWRWTRRNPWIWTRRNPWGWTKRNPWKLCGTRFKLWTPPQTDPLPSHPRCDSPSNTKLFLKRFGTFRQSPRPRFPLLRRPYIAMHCIVAGLKHI